MLPGDLFGRYLDLTPLGRRRRGLVRCPFHQDRTPSLSVDLDKAVFCCFGCGTAGGLAKFAELVGERLPGRTPLAWESPLDRARRAVLAAAHHRLDEQTLLIYQIADAIRIRRRAAAEARALATAVGPLEVVWGLLTLAAIVDTEAHRLEAALDEVLA